MKRKNIQEILTLSVLFLLFIPSPSWAKRMITGTILTPKGEPAVGVMVEAYDEDNNEDQHMGTAITDTQGKYSIGPYTGKDWDLDIYFNNSWRPDIYIKINQTIDGRQVTVGKSTTHEDHRQAQDLTIDFQLKGIVGTITDRSGRMMRHTLVKAFDEDDGSGDDFMNEVYTDASGEFSMLYEQKYECREIFSLITFDVLGDSCWDSPGYIRPDIYIEVHDQVRGRQIKINNKSATNSNVPFQNNVNIQESVPRINDIDYIVESPPEDNDILHVLAYNVFLLPIEFSSSGQKERIPKIAQEILRDEYDVIVLSEVFDNDLRKDLRKALAEKYPFHTQVLETDGSLWGDGGVKILSKWPIENPRKRIFGGGDGWDFFAEKGVLYVSIDKNGTRYHIFGTHVQAGNSDDNRKTRRSQFQKIKNFIDDMNISETEAVIIAGDLNVDKNDSLNEYNEMLQTLNAVPPALIGHPYSADGKINDFRDLGDSRQLLDYVLYSKDHKQPTKHLVRQTGISGSQLVPAAYNRVMFYRSDSPWRELPTQRYRWDISDHYPVFGWFDFKVNRSIITVPDKKSVEPSILQMAPRP